MRELIARDAPAPDRLGGLGGGRAGQAVTCRPSRSVPPQIVRRYCGDDAAAGRVLTDLLLGVPAVGEEGRGDA